MNANGFAGMVPISCIGEISKMDGVVAATPFSWYGGKYHDEVMPFSQFAVDAETVFTVMAELDVPPDQLKDFKENKDGCVIGYKLAKDRQLKVGDPLPLKGDMYPVDMNLTVRGIYSGPSQDRPADVPVSLRLPRRGPQEGHHELRLGGFAGSPERQAVGECRHDLHQVQERRHHALAGQEDRRPLSQQRLPHAHPDRGSLRQDVRRDAGRPEARHLRDRPGRRGRTPVRRGQRHGDGHARADQRGGRAQGHRLQQGTGAVPGPHRGGRWSRASAG